MRRSPLDRVELDLEDAVVRILELDELVARISKYSTVDHPTASAIAAFIRDTGPFDPDWIDYFR